MDKNPSFIKKYIKFVGSKENFVAKEAKCDVCGSYDNKVINIVNITKHKKLFISAFSKIVFIKCCMIQTI